MPRISLTLEEASKWFDTVAPQAFAAGAKRGLLSAAARIVSDIQTRIIPQLAPKPVDRGAYRAGWQFGEDDDGAYYENVLPHAPLLEWGVRAANVRVSAAMIDALTEWVERKGLGSGASARRLAWAIAHSQKMRGVFGNGFHVMDLANEMAGGYIREEVAIEIERELGGG